jgi:hypothetical protein
VNQVEKIKIKPECFDEWMRKEGLNPDRIYTIDLRREKLDGAYHINGKPYHQSRFKIIR